MPSRRQLTTFRDPTLSLLQSALHETLKRRSRLNLRLSTDHPAMQEFVDAANAKSAAPAATLLGPSTPSADAPAGVSCAKLYVEMGWAEIKGDRARRDQLAHEIKFSTCDPLWAEAVTTFLAWQVGDAPIPYVTATSMNDFVQELPPPRAASGLVVGIIGDWGTGTDEARWLLSRVVAQQPDVIIHLGDIYYSGTIAECTDNFLQPFTDLGVTAPVFTLAGNHDMYSGGVGYYGLLQQLKQPASFFCLRNADWQILGLDTGCNDSDPVTVSTNVTSLHPGEAAWHLDKIATANGRKTILLSHHQLFTAYGDGVGSDHGHACAVNPKLYQALGPILDRVTLWLWGHAHTLEIYQPHANLARGRCVGASAVPVRVTDNPYRLNPNLNPAPAATLPVEIAGLAAHGLGTDAEYQHAYAILRLGAAGAPSSAEYYEIDSVNHEQERLYFREAL